MRISDWSSDVCSSDLQIIDELPGIAHVAPVERVQRIALQIRLIALRQKCAKLPGSAGGGRSEEHTYELQSLMRPSYDVFCMKNKTETNQTTTKKHNTCNRNKLNQKNTNTL